MTGAGAQEDVEQRVVAALRERGALAGAAEADLAGFDYVAGGGIDSLGIVQLVTELEDTLDFRFGADDLLSDEFRTVGGLVGMVERLRA
ncbi:MAG: hypothetical protein JWM73_728 [Solirubrobacterales bacterium]|nr:hypothetical protein [Solirubrobacterales bacterium]